MQIKVGDNEADLAKYSHSNRRKIDNKQRQIKRSRFRPEIKNSCLR